MGFMQLETGLLERQCINSVSIIHPGRWPDQNCVHLGKIKLSQRLGHIAITDKSSCWDPSCLLKLNGINRKMLVGLGVSFVVTCIPSLPLNPTGNPKECFP